MTILFSSLFIVMDVLRYILFYSLPMSKIKILTYQKNISSFSSMYYAIHDIHIEIIVFIIKTIINIFINEEYYYNTKSQILQLIYKK